MVLISLLIGFILIVIYILLMPIVLFVDTNTNQYFIQLKGLVKISIEQHKGEILSIKLTILFMNFYFYPLQYLWIKKEKKTAVKHQKKREIGTKKMMRFLKSFKVKKLLLNIDTGNCILNAKLYPFFSLLNYQIGNFSINFQGRNRLVLEVENRPIDIIKSIINLKT